MLFDLNRVLEQIEKDKGIAKDVLVEAIESAMLSAARKKLGFYGDLEAHYNPQEGEVELFQFKTVAEEIEDDQLEIGLEAAHKLDPDCQLGDSIGQKIDSSTLGRIAAQTAKQVIIQKIRDAERQIVETEYQNRLGELITGIVRRFEKGNLVVDLGKTEALVPRKEQVPTETYKAGDRFQGAFVELSKAGRGPQIILSRRSEDFVKRLFEIEVPEVAEGIVAIKRVAREPGVRSKVAVYSKDSDVDPVGACVGMKGSRVQSVVQELKGERIDIVPWDTDPARFVCNAIAPAEVSKVIIKGREQAMEIIVPDDQLSLAIGRKGQNVRLAAKLTGWSVDIFSETRVEQLAKLAKERLVKHLGIDDAIASVLYSNAYRSVHEIAEVPEEEFLEIPGMDQDALRRIYARAKQVASEIPVELLEVPEIKLPSKTAVVVPAPSEAEKKADASPEAGAENVAAPRVD